MNWIRHKITYNGLYHKTKPNQISSLYLSIIIILHHIWGQDLYFSLLVLFFLSCLLSLSLSLSLSALSTFTSFPSVSCSFSYFLQLISTDVRRQNDFVIYGTVKSRQFYSQHHHTLSQV